MAEVTMRVAASIYGLHLAIAVAWVLIFCRVPADRAVAIGLRLVLVRIRVGGRSSWAWGGA